MAPKSIPLREPESKIHRPGLLQLLMVYILVLPFTFMLSIADILPLPLLVLIAVGPIVVANSGIRFSLRDAPIAITVFVGGVAILFSGQVSDRNASHFLALCVSVALYFFVVRSLIERATPLRAFAFLPVALEVSSVFVIAEFLFMNFVGIDPHSVLFGGRYSVETNATVFGAIYRARGFAIESGHMALFYELALPFSAVAAIARSGLRRWFRFSISLLAYILLFSAASLAALGVAMALVAFFTFPKSMKRAGAVIFVLGAVGVLMVASEDVRSYVELTVGAKLSALVAGDVNISSGYDRRARFDALAAVVSNNPMGLGWGEVASRQGSLIPNSTIRYPTSFVSLYGDVFAASGVVGLILLLVFLASRVRWALQNAALDSNLFALSVALIAMLLHYIFVGNYWYPQLWFGLALVDVSRWYQQVGAKLGDSVWVG